MQNELLMLGCGHSESDSMFNTNALIINQQGNLLIDAGYTIKPALKAQNLSIDDIDAVFITHVHADHVFGLERLAIEGLFKYQKRIKLIFHHSLFSELWENCLKGVLGKIGEGPADLNSYFDVQMLEDDCFNLFGNHYQLIKVNHTPNKPTYGLCVNQQLFYSADTLAIPEVIESLTFKVGIHDVTLAQTNPVHASLDSLMTGYPKEIRKKLWLTSYEDNWPAFENIVNQRFGGFAYQGQKIEF